MSGFGVSDFCHPFKPSARLLVSSVARDELRDRPLSASAGNQSCALFDGSLHVDLCQAFEAVTFVKVRLFF